MRTVTFAAALILALVPAGRDEERPFELAGDRLVLKPRWSQDGQEWMGVRVFERIK